MCLCGSIDGLILTYPCDACNCKLMATGFPQSCGVSLNHYNCGLFAVATREECRGESPYTLVCNPDRDFIRYDRLHAFQSACVMANHQISGPVLISGISFLLA